MTETKFTSQSKSLTIRRFFCYLVLVLLAFLSLFPFYILIINSTRTHFQIQSGFSAFPGKNLGMNFLQLVRAKEWRGPNGEVIKAFGTNYPIVKGLLRSLFVASLCALVTTYFSAMTSYGLYMYNFKLKKAAFRFILAVMMVPTQVSTLGFYKLLIRLNLMNNYAALIVPAIAAPAVFFYMYQAMEATLPYSIVEASRVDGCNEFRTFNVIVLPMMKPAIAVQAIFSFVSSWNNYFIPSLILEKDHWTVPLVVAAARSADYMSFNMGIIYILLTVAIIPLLIAYMFLSKSIIAGVTAGGVKE